MKIPAGDHKFKINLSMGQLAGEFDSYILPLAQS